MKNKNMIKKINSIIILISILLVDVVCAKTTLPDGATTEVAAPVAEVTDNISQSILRDIRKNDIYGPLNPTPSTAINYEEYNLVNNYDLRLEYIPYRVKYFAPTYLYALDSAENNVRVQLYSAGGSENNIEVIRQTMKDFPTQKKTLNSNYSKLNGQLTQLKNSGASDSDDTVVAIKTAIAQIQMGLATINATDTQLHTAVSGYNRVLTMIKSIDNNNTIIRVKNLLSKSMSSAFLSYKQLEFYDKILTNQVDLYEKIYKLYQKNFELGIATYLDVESHRLDYENTKKDLRANRTTMRNVKELVGINLGYDLSEINKINFIEPKIDNEYVESINLEEDYQMAYYTNSTYDNVRKAGENKKRLPESTSKQVHDEYLTAIKNKVITGLNAMYQTIRANKLMYHGSRLQQEILNLDKIALKNKKENNLVSETEYLGLQIQNLATEMKIKSAKYQYITAIINYYYGTYGFVDIE